MVTRSSERIIFNSSRYTGMLIIVFEADAGGGSWYIFGLYNEEEK